MLSLLAATVWVGLFPPAAMPFCAKEPIECQQAVPAVYSDFAILDEVNRKVNREITYRKEIIDSWDLSPKYGDCDDYAVTKRKLLAYRGVPRGAMKLAYVLWPSGIAHIALVVSTPEGDFVLDNGDDEIYELNRMPAERLTLSDPTNPIFWWEIPL